jgi:hypothetical protein
MTKDNSFSARELRRREAAIRQEEYNQLSLQDKLDKSRAINPASRETVRLNEDMEASGGIPVPKKGRSK